MADSSAPARRLAIVSAIAEGSTAVRLLKQHHYTVRVTGGATASSAAADIVLPGSRGGSLAFVLHVGALHPASIAQVAERAIQASRAARRCTVLWLCADDIIDDDAMEALQLASPAGVSVAVCWSHEEIVDHMLACSAASQAGAAPSGSDEADQLEHATERACSMLATLWGVEQHAVAFMLAARPFSSLAKVTSEEEWQKLLLETDGLLDAELLFMCIDWLQRDQALLW